MISRLPYGLSLAVVLAATIAVWRAWQLRDSPHYGTESVPASEEPPQTPVLTEFSLQERSGREFHSRDMEGRVWVASFFFTRCAGSCVQLNQALRSLHDNEAFRDVRFVSISCDPDTDTADVLANYALRFGADPERWLFCRGELPYLERIGKDCMQLTVTRQTHSDRAVVFDRSGRIRGRFLVTDPNQLNLMSHRLAECLREKPATAGTGGSSSRA